MNHITHGSFFSGGGGFDIASEWMGWENLFHCEWEPFPQRVLKYYWPNAQSYGDITKTDFSPWRGRISITTGGFPCQPFSTAGKRKGTYDGRYLWPEYLRAIREIQPLAVVAENVTGILSMGEYEVFARVDSRKLVRFENFDHFEGIYTRQERMLVDSICEDLEKEGYNVQPLIIPAAGIGAPHKRDRIWIVAYSESQRHESSSNIRKSMDSQEGKIIHGRERHARTNAWSGFPTQSPICSGNDGFSGELDGITFSNWRNESIKLYGNAVVPQVPFEIFKALEPALKKVYPTRIFCDQQ